ncbi:hypothetical protein Trydic_g15548 [Trypoxylus dichotomus]
MNFNRFVNQSQQISKQRHRVDVINAAGSDVGARTTPLTRPDSVGKCSDSFFSVSSPSVGERWEEEETDRVTSTWSYYIINDPFLRLTHYSMPLYLYRDLTSIPLRS